MVMSYPMLDITRGDRVFNVDFIIVTRKVIEVPQPSDPREHVADEAFNEDMDDSLERVATTAISLDAYSSGGSRCQEIMRDTVAQTRSKRVSKIFNDPLLTGVNTPKSGEDSLKLNELIELCTKLQQRVLDLEITKTTQALVIDSLKRRVKKLEKRKRSRTHGLKRLYKFELSGRVQSSKDEGLGEEDASKQERIADIDANKDIYLVNVHNDEDMFGVNDLNGDEVIIESVDVAKQAKEVIDDITLAKALMEIKSAKPKADKVVIQEPKQSATITTAAGSRPKAKGLVIHEQEQTPTPIISLQQPSQNLPSSYKLKTKKKKKGLPEKNLNKLKKLQAEEQEELTDAEKAKLFMQFLEKGRKCFAAKRAKEKRNRPPTRAQQRSIIYKYLKNLERYKPVSLKSKSFDNIQEMFNKAMKRVNFVDYRTELVLKSSKKAKAEVREGSLKRVREELKQENAKKQKIEDDKESTELKQCFKIIPDDGDDVTVDANLFLLRIKILDDLKQRIEKVEKILNETKEKMLLIKGKEKMVIKRGKTSFEQIASVLRTKLVVESLKEAEAQVTEVSSKRAREELEQENAKKQKMEDDKEFIELKQCLEIIPGDGDDLQVEEEEEEERHAREKAQQIEEVNIAWDDIQAKIDDDYQLAQRLQAK
nr:hypothetical protein [Tanacetum cinerariifolium]